MRSGRPWRARIGGAVGLALLLLVWAPQASAAGQPGAMNQEAKGHLDRGLRFYNIGEFDKALDEFKAGYQADPRPEFLYAIGQAERKAHHCQKAVDAYRAFLRTNPPPEQEAVTKRNLDQCEQEIAAQPPPPPPTESPPQEAPPSASTQPVTPGPDAPGGSSHWYKDWVGHVLVGTGVVAMVVGALVLKSGNDDIDAANQSYDQYVTFKMMGGALDSAQQKQTIGVVTLATGGALVAAGVVHYLFFSRAGGGRKAGEGLSVAAGPGSGWVGWGGNF